MKNNGLILVRYSIYQFDKNDVDDIYKLDYGKSKSNFSGYSWDNVFNIQLNGDDSNFFDRFPYLDSEKKRKFISLGSYAVLSRNGYILTNETFDSIGTLKKDGEIFKALKNIITSLDEESVYIYKKYLCYFATSFSVNAELDSKIIKTLDSIDDNLDSISIDTGSISDNVSDISSNVEGLV